MHALLGAVMMLVSDDDDVDVDVDDDVGTENRFSILDIIQYRACLYGWRTSG